MIKHRSWFIAVTSTLIFNQYEQQTFQIKSPRISLEIRYTMFKFDCCNKQ